jgi:pimeloyl-ACP methyl ester carboxylesterase
LPILTDPGAYGHNPAGSFDIVIPSLPAFGYSDKPEQPDPFGATDYYDLLFCHDEIGAFPS